jgi:hypothetical protein
VKNNDATAPLTVVTDNPVDTPEGTDQQEPTTTDQGQANDDKGVIDGQAEPTTDGGQDDASGQEPNIPEFFDPNNVPEELMPAYKNMQKAFTSKTQAIANDRQKIQQYDDFMANPMASINKLAQQYGFQLSPQGGQPADQGQQAEDFAPQTWDEVFNALEQRLLPKIQSNMQPIVNSVQEITQKNIEKQLTSIDPNWKLYEDEMQTLLQTHPYMAQDVNLLYRSAVPAAVLNQKAVQAALKKINNKVKGSTVHGSSTSKTETPAIEVKSFSDAVRFAKEKLKNIG